LERKDQRSKKSKSHNEMEFSFPLYTALERLFSRRGSIWLQPQMVKAPFASFWWTSKFCSVLSRL